jgi:SAM-dependent methyltransferase
VTTEFYRNRAETADINQWHRLVEVSLRPWLNPGTVVAEFGAGSGTFLAMLVAKYGVVGHAFDISNANLEMLKGRGLEARMVDFGESPYPIPSDSIPVAITCEVLEHLLDPKLFVREIHRVLAPDGCLCITTPNAFNIRRRLSFLVGFHADPLMDPTRSQFAAHLRAFSFSMVERLLEDVGFSILERRGDRVPHAQINWLGPVRSLLSSEVCILAQKKSS